MGDYSTILSKMKQEIVRLTEKISGSMHRPGFEHFRVRSLKSINALNFWLGVCMMFLASLKERERTNLLYRECIEAAKPIRDAASP